MKCTEYTIDNDKIEFSNPVIGKETVVVILIGYGLATYL